MCVGLMKALLCMVLPENMSPVFNLEHKGNVNNYLVKNTSRALVAQFSKIHIGTATFTSYSRTPFMTLEGIQNRSLQNKGKIGSQQKEKLQRGSGNKTQCTVGQKKKIIINEYRWMTRIWATVVCFLPEL